MRIIEDLLVIPSENLDRNVTVQFLLPENYRTTENLGLLILNDGQDMEQLKIKSTIQHLTESWKLMPLVVAGVHAGERLQEYGTSGIPDVKKRGSKAQLYTHFVLNELLPAIHTVTGTETFATTAIAGCSLGALSAMDIALKNPEYFDTVGAFSGSFWWRDAQPGKKYSDDRNRIMHQQVKNIQEKPNLRFWFQTGTMDETADRNNNGIIDSVDDTTDLIAELLKKGYTRPDDICYTEVVNGRHNQETWSMQMPRFLEWSFPNRFF